MMGKVLFPAADGDKLMSIQVPERTWGQSRQGEVEMQFK
jgi:hypothetical protein